MRGGLEALLNNSSSLTFGHRSLSTLTAEDAFTSIRLRQQQASAGTIRREWPVLMRMLNLGAA